MQDLHNSEESWYIPIVAQLSLNTSRREGAAAGGSMQLYADTTLNCIPEGPRAHTGARVEAADGPYGPGPPRFCPGSANAFRTG